jgi:hypothetical protein
VAVGVWKEPYVLVEPDNCVRVVAGTAPPDLHWAVVVSGDEHELFTMLHVYAGDRLVAGSGFGGPPLYPGSLINQYHGRTDDLPWFVMARTSPVVDRVVATTESGREITLTLSPPIEQFGLRFAAAPLPDGERPRTIRIEQDSVVLESAEQRVGPPLPPLSGAGWIPDA